MQAGNQGLFHWIYLAVRYRFDYPSIVRSTLCTGLWAVLLAVTGQASLTLEPTNIRLAHPGATQRFIIPGGTNCEAFSNDPRIVTIEQHQLVARATGSTKIKVQCTQGSAVAQVEVAESDSVMGVGFERDLLSILTTKGCNSSACHGSPAGQNEFKLSLYGSDPHLDYKMIRDGHDGRRISTSSPEDSLLLTKPAFVSPHGGGQLMTTESDEYHTILEWIRQGTPYGSQGTQLERLEMVPTEMVLAGMDASQSLVVIGRLSDGTTRDMTAQVRLSVNDSAVVDLQADGSIRASSPGITTVMARAMGKTATSQFIVITELASKDYKQPPAGNRIDRYIFDKLHAVNIEPFPLSDDRTFLRRVYLDVTGMLPTLQQTDQFLDSYNPEKRSLLINELLDSAEYSTHWLVKFEDWFRNSQYYSQGRTNGSFKRWLHQSIQQDWPYDRTAHEMIAAVGDTSMHPAGNFWHPAIDFMLKKFEVEKAVPTITRLFLGKRLECAQCHNHPLENLTQDDFFGLAAFLARTRVKHGYGQYRRIWYNDRQGEIMHPLTKQPVAPRFLDGKIPAIPADSNRRTVLADWIIQQQQMQFARATVNRIWYEYFQRGIVEPFDDFRSTNRPTHPELLDVLAQYFIDSGFRFKALHRLILNSRTYQLAAHTNSRPGGEDPLEDVLFARYTPRKLPAEVLLDSISQVTGVSESFSNYPPDTSPKQLIASIGATYFLTTFGHPRRDIMGARSNTPSLSQALQMMNGDVLSSRLDADTFILDELVRRGLNNREIVEQLYLRAYSRKPQDTEWKLVLDYLAAEEAAGRPRNRSLANVLWAMLNTKEFQMNF